MITRIPATQVNFTQPSLLLSPTCPRQYSIIICLTIFHECYCKQYFFESECQQQTCTSYTNLITRVGKLLCEIRVGKKLPVQIVSKNMAHLLRYVIFTSPNGPHQLIFFFISVVSVKCPTFDFPR